MRSALACYSQLRPLCLSRSQCELQDPFTATTKISTLLQRPNSEYQLVSPANSVNQGMEGPGHEPGWRNKDMSIRSTSSDTLKGRSHHVQLCNLSAHQKYDTPKAFKIMMNGVDPRPQMLPVPPNQIHQVVEISSIHRAAMPRTTPPAIAARDT